MSDLRDVSLIIKTFDRPQALDRLLASLRRHGYGDCPVLIADDSNDPYRDAVMRTHGDIVDEYVVLPFDTGVSKGRNELLKRVETDYFVINDDDFVYDERTDIEWMREQVAASNLDLLGGVVFEPREFEGWSWRSPVDSLQSWAKHTFGSPGEISRDWHGELNREGQTLQLRKSNHWSPPYTRCDFTLQFFLARTDAVWSTVGGWANPLKCFGEHWEFFYRVKQAGLEVAFTMEAGVRHLPISNPEYAKHRFDREEQDMQKALALHDLDIIEFHSPEGVRRIESD